MAQLRHSKIFEKFSNLQVDAMQNFFSMLQGYLLSCNVQDTIQSGGEYQYQSRKTGFEIEDGDLVQVIVIPIERKHKNNSVK